nr:UbiA family prenyltransferase [uncultured Desulfobacter sp.]
MRGWKKTMRGNSPISVQAAGSGSLSGLGMFPLLFELTKIRLTLYMGLSGATGFVLAQTRPSTGAVVVGFWIVVLAAGSAVVNNIQDRFYDKKFERTRERVLPCGRISLPMAVTLALFFSLTGLAGLCHLSFMAGALGGGALILYNGIYTPLKKKYPMFALVPGAVCGMLPPAIGWAAATASDPGAVSIIHLWTFMACLGVWQWPHSLLIFAAYPSTIGNRMTAREMNCLIMIWTLLFSQAVLLFILHQGIILKSLAISIFLIFILFPVFIAGVIFIPRDRKKEDLPWADARKKACLIGFKFTNLVILTFFAAVLTDRLVLFFARGGI